MSIQRIFSLLCCIIALLGIFGSLQQPLTNTIAYNVETIGRGFLPLLYSLASFFFGVFLFFSDKNNKKFNFSASLLMGPGCKALVFFLLNILLIVLFYIFGSFIAVFVFSILACIVFKRLSLRLMFLFSIVFTGVFYFIFVTLLKTAFRRGIIFEMLGWYI